MAKKPAGTLSSTPSSKPDLGKKEKGKGKSVKVHPSVSEVFTGSVDKSFSEYGVRDDEASKKAHALAYQVLSKEDSEELLTLPVLEMESKLKDVLQLNPTTCLRDAATLDFFVGAVYWGKQKEFTVEQLSGFFTVVHVLFHKIKDDHVSMIELLKEFRKQLVGIGTELSPEIESGGIEFFNVEQASAITGFLQSTLLHHFKLYEFMFTESQLEEIVGSDLTVEVPMPAATPFPPPLDEGISESVYREFLSIPTPSTSEVIGEGEKEEEIDETPSAELPPEAADLFAKLTPEDVKSIVEEVSKEMLQSLQVGVENKIRGTENAILARINKIHNIPPEPTKEPASQDDMKF